MSYLKHDLQSLSSEKHMVGVTHISLSFAMHLIKPHRSGF